MRDWRSRRSRRSSTAIPANGCCSSAITGTNGKTTTSYLLASVFEAAGLMCGRIGTVGYRVGRKELDAERTTPEAPELQAMLRDMVSQGCGACVMEVSSHALALRRVDYLRFAAGIFTNLTRDHLDFHRNMEEYFAAKRRLFEVLPDNAVAAIESRRPARLRSDAKRAPAGHLRDRRGRRRQADGHHVVARGRAVRAQNAARHAAYPFAAGRQGQYATTFWRPRRPRWRSICRSARSNAASPISTHVPGRFQVVSERRDDVRVVVDYAHTDDALKNLLETARPLATGRIITVFGCGGDRDRSKRPLMGAVAARLSDVVVVTSDNPRSENPADIIEEIKRGIVEPDRPAGKPKPGQRDVRCIALVDRREAIERAVREAVPGDLILVAGKGHEKYQVIGDRVLPFDDVEIAKAALERRRAGSRVS